MGGRGGYTRLQCPGAAIPRAALLPTKQDCPESEPRKALDPPKVGDLCPPPSLPLPGSQQRQGKVSPTREDYSIHRQILTEHLLYAEPCTVPAMPSWFSLGLYSWGRRGGSTSDQISKEEDFEQ
jgi:hypothetical protein